jgi:TRAP-type C4-dicarboxylate transport system permease small subunit
MKFLEKLNTLVANIETILLVFIVLAMVLLSFLQVILRNVFEQGILWGDIFLRHLVLWVGFIGASLATKENKHINIDVLGRILRGRKRLIAQGITQFFSAFIVLILIKAAWTFVQQERMFETTLFNDIPAWYFQIIIPIGFTFICLRFILQGLQSWINAFKGGAA